eukprot:COSAG06_NODE_59659_length_273_cov_0.896552_1_plen_77_part_01
MACIVVWCGHWGVYNSTQVWYSDDNGQSYTLSDTVFDYMDECTLAELGDGRCARTGRFTLHVPNFPWKHVRRYCPCL